MSRQGFRGAQKAIGSGLAVAALGVAVVGSSQMLFNVDGGFRAVKYSRFSGVMDKVYNEGTHIVIPWLERFILFDARAKPMQFSSGTGTKGKCLTI